MKKRLTFRITCLATILTLFYSCSKEENPPPQPTKTELISQGTWKFSTAFSGATNVSGLIQVCIKDNIYTFVATGTGTMDEGATKCNAGDPQTNPLTWNFAMNETILHVSTILFPGGNNDFTLESISASQLVVSQTVTIGGPPQNVVVTFVH